MNTTSNFHSFTVTTIDGKELNLSTFKGKKVLVVNVASECGYTPQYKQLQELYTLYKDKGLEILGFPANNFGAQEPGTDSDIKLFCEKNYGVSFTMCTKISVAGTNKHPLYGWLSDAKQNGWNNQEPQWNFGKYLINEKGELVKYFSSAVNPLDKEITSQL